MLITVAICTWNRAALLDRTLQQLRCLQIPAGVDYEVLVVNNRCTDHTDDVLAKHAADLPLRRLYEPEAGLSNARNCAMRHARGELVIWTDDDVLVAPQWLAAYCEACRKYPEAAFFGGPIRPWFEVTPPAWITANMSRLAGVHALRDLGETSFVCDDDSLPYGANFAVRSETLRKYRFDPKLGRMSSQMLSGEETKLLQQMRADGYQGRWIPTAVVRHFVPRQRLTLRYTRRFFAGLGRTAVLVEGRTVHPRATLWRKALQLEFKYQLHYWISRPEKWLTYLIRSSQYWGQLKANVPRREQRKAA